MSNSPWSTSGSPAAATASNTPVSTAAATAAAQAAVDHLNSPDWLANADKIQLMNDWNAEKALQGSPSAVGSLDYQAAQYGVSSTSYDAAVTAIDTYLGTTLGYSTWKSTWPDGATINVTGIMTTLKGLWGTVSAARQILESAIGAGYVSTAATDALNKANGAILVSQPHLVSWAFGSEPALPNGSYPAGYFAITTDSRTEQVNSAGTAWVPIKTATAGLIGTIADAMISGLSASKVTGTLTDAQLAAISAAKVTGQITGTQISNGAVSTPQLAAGAVTAAQIAANTITAAQIAANTITTSQLAAGSVQAGQIAAGAVQAGNVAAGAIQAGDLAA